MKKTILFFIFINTAFCLLAQQPTRKVFWKETFDSGVLPTGWKAVAMNDSAVNWFVTNQPFPGSAGRENQAPPIASNSRGYHLQFAPGVKTGKFYRRWRKAGVFPDAYVMTAPIDCSQKKSVVLSFQQNFFWNDDYLSTERKTKISGLFVGVSNNGNDWTEYEVRNGVGEDEDCPNPMNVELNITNIAASQKNVYLRFYWKGFFRWYWMIDDIELAEGYDNDVEALKLSSHPQLDNKFTNNDELTFKVVNVGGNKITTNFDCYLQIDKRPIIKTAVAADVKKPIEIIDTVLVKFPNLNLADFGLHNILFYTDLKTDSRKNNDSISTTLYSGAFEIGGITKFKIGKTEYEFQCGNAKLKLQFLRDDIFRLWMAYDGEFTNPAANDIVINPPTVAPEVSYTDENTFYQFKTKAIYLRAYKKPLKFALYKNDNKTLIWEEVRPMSYGKYTTQYLKRGDNEYFYGGGMQNGRVSHRDKTIKMNIDYNWSDGGNPNPAPFFMSTNGFGALRNTYAPGEYSFKDTVKLKHEEARFDCYYFAGNSLKDILNDYTDITGKPFLMPRWALSMGDANCYNRGANTANKTIGTTESGHTGLTPSVISLIADKYVENNMPRGWILPNDGYGCGYTKLDSVVIELHKRGFYTGLWTESGVEKIAREVGQLGTRLCKLDVAWVGPGYKFALDGATAAYNGIENNSDARGFVWEVCGWAGSQRNAVLWTGDESGSWNYIRWHIPSVVGSGMSAINCATGDVDGIFGGSDSTYTRDLQWKCFTPVFMCMSGWASNNKNGIVDKQPWLFGEPFTSINRKYLMLKQRFTPYMYTLCNEAHQTGVPAVRALVLEYPDDAIARGTKTQYQYLLGQNLLVAPVYKSEAKRDSIYLPKGNWIDYWDGTTFTGSTFLNNYSAPLDKLPLFVKAGSILPLYQQMMYDWESPTDTLTLDIYPLGKSEFEMYEDDGLTREHRKGAFTLTKFEVSANENGSMEIVLNAAKGDFKGRLKNRTYLLDVHTKFIPKQILFNNKKLKAYKTETDFNKAQSGWYSNPNSKQGTLFIKTEKISTDIKSIINLK